MLGYSQAWSYGVEKGRHAPGPEVLAQMATILGVSIEYLVRGTDPEGDSEFVARLRAAEQELTRAQRRELLGFAEVMVASARKERAHQAELESVIQYVEGELSPAHAQLLRDALAAEARARSPIPSAPTLRTAEDAVS